MNLEHPRHNPGRVLFGAAYYAEYHQSPRMIEDLDLMREAGFSVIRVGESVWSTWEPTDGEFDLEWLAPVLDAAHERGIDVIIGTPTYAVPPWLQVAYPEIAGERRTGERIPWGARQEVDYTHPAFLFHAERVIRRIMERYAQHPAVIGFQVDNEPGLELFHNHGVFTKFVRRLEAQYGDVETLNREWGLTYWSHRLSSFSELWRPDGNTFPQYDLAWRRFQAELTTEFIGWQADLVGEYSRPEQFVTTCLQYPRRGLDDQLLGERLDISAGNPYYGMQDHLDRSVECAQPNYWTTTGVAGLLRQADRMYSSKQGRYLVTETNAQSIGAAETNYPPYPGQLKQAAFALISRGAAMIEYWHWHTLPYGTETYWGGVIPHSLKPGRVYREIADIGQDLKALGTTLDGYQPDADVALLWSNPSRFALQYMPPLASDGLPDEESYEKLFDAFHRGVIDAGRQARILHLPQALTLGADELVAQFPVLVAAGAYIMSDDEIELLQTYVRLGGHLVLGPRSGYADAEARVRVAVAPSGFTEIAAAHYEEYSNLDRPVPVRGTIALPLGNDHGTGGGADRAPDHAEGSDAYGKLWVDGLITDGADVLATYDHPRFKDFPAITTNTDGSGRVTLVGCVPSPALAASVIRWAAPASRSPLFATEPAHAVSISSGTLPDGRSVQFLFNWGWTPQTVELAHATTDAITGEFLTENTRITLDGWATRTFVG
ncbi:beta-galactosidase [Arthrobacter sp. TMS1-12-1]